MSVSGNHGGDSGKHVRDSGKHVRDSGKHICRALPEGGPGLGGRVMSREIRRISRLKI